MENTKYLNKKYSIVFMGTPEYAVEILKSLFENGVIIKSVITSPDKRSGRGQKIKNSPVKEYALKNNLSIMQPQNLKEKSFIKKLTNLKADLFVVVAFRMLPEIVWQIPPKGTVNLHTSLLPNYRGAAPINWAIINGEKITGVTTFFIESQIDTGEIIDQTSVEINENENFQSLHNKLIKIGSKTLIKTVTDIFNNNFKSTPQKNLIKSTHKKAPKIFKEDCKINFNQPVKNVHNFCRGLSPYPGPWIKFIDKKTNKIKTMKIFESKITNIHIDKSSNINKNENGLLFPCNDYYLEIHEIQIQGKRKMNFKDFLAGNNVNNISIINT
ncbi:MAG: methionyl-tRNA formyltransferase [Crocinitomicaceae bacterium]|nr:methionyl-tRNA formyltransferase [Crocinitomicaceae bacterium]|tara:strand:- start:87469 stop:88449 length:981 start_codon:yes stop_codon:yes gene_type:complete